MKKNYVLFTALLLLLGVVSASAVENSGRVPADSDSNGLLYSITGKDLKKTSYLFGTIHIVCPTDMLPKEALGSYLKKTERLMLELDMDDPTVSQKMLSAMNMTNGKTLKDYLTTEKYEKVDQMFKSVVGVPVAALGSFSPIGLTVIISTTPKSTGCAVPSSYESTLLEIATTSKLAIDGLESVEDQIAALAKTPVEKQAEDLYKLSLDPNKAVDSFKSLLAAYKLQDSEKLHEFILRESAESPEFEGNLLTERNQKWIPKIETAMAEKSSFFAVGGGHLGGPSGVVALLRARGYTVTAIKL